MTGPGDAVLGHAPSSESDALEIVVAPERAGTRLDRFLAAAVGSRSRAESLIAAGRVRVDGRRRPKSHPVVPGSLVTVTAPPAAERPGGPGDQAPFSVAYEDERLLVVDKPAGVVVHPAR